MSRIIALVLFIGFLSTANAQSAKMLEGKWIFKEALNKGIDKDGRKTLKKDVINKMTLEFKGNGDFTGSLFGAPASGKWLLANDSKSLVLNAEGEKFEFSILELTADRLVLKFGLGEFLMKKL
ncbi:lipocalin family protein [Flavobacterium sp.]|uniref:lipocalin family protein n=1 Tax=Flavobacterium sp. TaxID=239 RepID=UPI0039E47D81